MIGDVGGIFAALYVGHQVADHILQTDRMAVAKSGHGRAAVIAMTVHVASHFLCQGLAIAALASLEPDAPVFRTPWPVLVGLTFYAVTHAFIDRRWPVQVTCHRTGSPGFATPRNSKDTPGFVADGPYLVDQTLHHVCAFLAALIIAGLGS